MNAFLRKRIINSIVTSNLFIGKKAVLQVEEIETVLYTERNRNILIEIVRSGNYELIKFLEKPKALFDEELMLIKFRDEKQLEQYAVCYDSAATAYPEVIAIYPAVKPTA